LADGRDACLLPLAIHDKRCVLNTTPSRGTILIF
jgi:hypothetical protein